MIGQISFLRTTDYASPESYFINQSKYALESLKKYSFDSCDPVDTPMVEKSKLDEDKEGKVVDPSHYRGMIGTLLYLTASRPDLQFAICMCARYQARPTEKHLHAVKRIFRYLRGTVNRGLWYPKDSSIALTTFADADHAGCQDTRRSTSGSMQFLGDRLVSWSSKRQKSAAISSTKAEYIAIIMSITKEQQQALDDALVPREQRLRIGNCNYRLSTTFKPKEPTFQVALDVLSLTPFYQAFLISSSVPAIYMHEFWAISCPNLPGQKFKDPPFEEDILAFIRELGYLGDIKSLSDVKVDTLYQPWRTFRTIIIKCLNGKVIGLDLLHLSQAQIIWGMYNHNNVDYVYLLWEDLVYQIENKVSNKNKDMYYPRFTKVIINHFMSKDQLIPRRNKYGAIIPDTLTNQAMKESEAYKTYHDFATGKVIPKPNYVWRSNREKTDQAPTASPGKRLKSTTKVAKSGKKKLPAQGLETLSEIALFEAEQIKIVTKRSKTQFHSSHVSGSSANERTGVSPGVPDVPTYGSKDEQISWKSSDGDDDDEVSLSKDDDNNANNEDHDGQDDDNEQTKLDNDGDNVEDEELDEEETNEEEETNVLGTQVIEDTNVIITAVTPEVKQQSSSVSSGFISNMLNPNPDTGIDSILNLNTKSTSLADVPITKNVEMPPSSVTTPPPPPIPLIQPLQQTPVPTPTIVPSSSLQNLPTFGSLFKFEDRVKALEDNFSKFKQTNLFAEAVSSIPDIVDKYLANQMNEAVKAARRRAGKEPESTSTPKEKSTKSTKEGSKSHQKSTSKSAQAKEPIHTVKDLEEHAHQEFDTGFTEGKPIDETTQLPDCTLARNEDPQTTDQLDWNNPEGHQYPHDIRKPLPMIPNLRGRRVIPFDNFINNDLAYLSGGVLSRTYATSVTKTKAADYGHIKWIEDIGQKCQQFYGYAVNKESAHDVYSRNTIIGIKKLMIVEWHNYKHLEWITIHRDDDKLYTFKEGDYNRLRLQDIKDMLLLLVQGKLTNLNIEERLALGVSLRMFTRSTVIRRRMEDL
ncbi:hypothetical protein Tco_0256136 [Tanacetum coccineum]